MHTTDAIGSTPNATPERYFTGVDGDFGDCHDKFDNLERKGISKEEDLKLGLYT